MNSVIRINGGTHRNFKLTLHFQIEFGIQMSVGEQASISTTKMLLCLAACKGQADGLERCQKRRHSPFVCFFFHGCRIAVGANSLTRSKDSVFLFRIKRFFFPGRVLTTRAAVLGRLLKLWKLDSFLVHWKDGFHNIRANEANKRHGGWKKDFASKAWEKAGKGKTAYSCCSVRSS